MENVYLWTPSGRMVQGHPMDTQTKDMDGNLLTNKDGQPRVKYFLAIAIAKTDPAWPAFYSQLQAVGQAGFPQGQSLQPDFSWKVTDGDDPVNAAKPGFPGCWILKCSNGFKPDVYDENSQVIVTKEQLHRGDFVRANVSISANGSTTRPGVYVNPRFVQKTGYGEEIKTGPDAVALMAATPATLPPGASAVPLTPAIISTPAVPVPGAVPVAVPPVPVPVAVPPVPVAPVAQPDFINPVAVPQMTAAAAGQTYEAMIALGWNDATLRANGYMI